MKKGELVIVKAAGSKSRNGADKEHRASTETKRERREEGGEAKERRGGIEDKGTVLIKL